MCALQAACETSLKLKSAEVGGYPVRLWGKLVTTSGVPYLVAYSAGKAFVFEGKLDMGEGSKIFYSTDGTTWCDMPMCIPEEMEVAAKVTGWLTGDPSHVFEIPVPAPEPEPVPEGEEAPEVEAPPPLTVGEIAVLCCRVISMPRVTPKGMAVLSAENYLEVNPSFAGLDYPDKLESYVTSQVPGAPTLADSDVVGSWSLTYDSFKQIATLKSLAYPGVTFAYDNSIKAYYTFYTGPGLKNIDLAFMI